MHSRNGTFVNGQAIKTRTPLKHNDRLRLCDFLATDSIQIPVACHPEPLGCRGGERKEGDDERQPSGP